MRTLFLCVGGLLMMSSAPVLARESMQQRGEAELAKELQGRIAGKPVHCLTTSRVDGSHIIDGTAIVYRALGDTIYVNRPRGAEMLREDDIPVQFLYGSQMCNLDQIKLLDRSTRMQRGFIGLGDFVPYTKPGKRAR